jgi:hypothetical protein
MRLFGEHSIGGTLIPLNLWTQTDPLPIGMFSRAHARQIQSKPFLAVEPGFLQVESRDAQHSLDHFERVLVAVFGMNALACPELNGQPRHA